MEQQYDPVKAHEYYEKTKQLKGKTKSATTDETKTTTTTKKKSKKKKLTAAQKAARKKKQAALKSEFSGKIDKLRQKMKKIKGKGSEYYKLKIRDEISELREQYAKKKKSL